jgi:hypothetical protein
MLVFPPFRQGIPLVTTTLGAEGMQLALGSSADLCAAVADDAPGFAEALQRLYQDEKRWGEAVRSGREHLERHFTAEAQSRALVELLTTALARPRRYDLVTEIQE